jgi:hypothetical protein
MYEEASCWMRGVHLVPGLFVLELALFSLAEATCHPALSTHPSSMNPLCSPSKYDSR